MEQPNGAQQLKERFVSHGGIWSDDWASILSLNPEYFEAYLKLREAPLKKKALQPKVQQFVLIAVESACTTLYEPGIKDHIHTALEIGATKQEIFEVLELASVLGVHSMTAGLEVLQETLKENGTPLTILTELDPTRQALKEKFETQRGYWSQTWQTVLSISPDFFDAYTDFSTAAFKPDGGYLDKKVKELIYCAIDVSTTHLYLPGLKIHIQNALRYGATTEEIVEVFELAALIGVHTPMAAVKYLAK